MKKITKKFLAVAVSLAMVISAFPLGAMGNSFAAGTETQSPAIGDETITLPLKIRDTYMDGFIFEYNSVDGISDYAFGETTRPGLDDKGNSGITPGIVQNTLVDGKPVYSSATEIGIKGLAENIQSILKADSSTISKYYSSYSSSNTSGRNRNKTLYNALKQKIVKNGSVNLGSKSDKPATFDEINSCYGAAYWMTQSLFRDNVTFTFNGKTYNYTKNVSEYENLVLNKQDDGSYLFEATTTNSNVVYDTANKTIQNGNATSRGGFFPVDKLGLNESSMTLKDGTTHNFAFTLESSGKFVYHKDENLYFDFSGDDDVYLFINNKLALDIGGQHGQLDKKVMLESQYDSTQTWAEYLGLQEGESYDFNFFYMERHTSASNMRIRTNIRVYDPSAVPEKNAYVGDDQVPYGGLVPNGTKLNYEFVLNNDGDMNLTDLTFKDAKLGVEITKDAITLNDETTMSDLTAQIVGKDGTVVESYTSLTEQQLKDILAKGITVGQSIKIKGFNYILNSENAFINTVVYTAKAGEKSLTNSAQTSVIPIKDGEKIYVIDYAKPVSYSYDDVFKEVIDSFGGASKITNHVVTLQDVTGIYGDMSIDSANRKITYTLNKIMNGTDTFVFNHKITYKAEDGKVGTTSTKTVVKMMPATTVYYEENFIGNGDVNTGIVYDGSWEVKEDATSNDNLQKGDGAYGYDTSYGDDSKDSNGTVYIGDASKGSTTAKFNFKGTGFDIIGRTSYDSGSIRVDVYKVDEAGVAVGSPVKSKIVVNEYRDGANDSTLYQIPVLKVHDLEYGKYQVVIKVAAANIFTSNSILYLDGIRIYDPLYDDAQANDKYYEDNEGAPQYIELRDKLIAENDLDADGTKKDAVLFVDSNGKANLDEYKQVGPANEIYLANGQSVGFKLSAEAMANVASIQLGAKSIDGNASIVVGTDKVEANNKTIALNSATDMYYDITEQIKADNILFIKSTGVNPASLTQLKITYKQPAAQPAMMMFMVDNDVLSVASLMYAVEEEPTVPETPAEPEQPEEPATTLVINNVVLNKTSVKTKKDLKMTITTNKDVESVIVLDKNGQQVKINKVVVKETEDTKTFQIMIKAPSKKDKQCYYQVIGVNGELQSEPFTTATVVVK